MGCVLCNITRVESFDQGGKKVKNPFYCKTPEEEREFLSELASDIAINHPEMVRSINTVSSLKNAAYRYPIDSPLSYLTSHPEAAVATLSLGHKILRKWFGIKLW